MDWQLVHSVIQNPLTTNIFKPSFLFNSKDLIIEAKLATALGSQQDWYRAGFVSPVFSFPEIGLVNGQKQDIILKRQHLRMTNLSFPYEIEFYFHDWISSISLRFWKFNSVSGTPEIPIESNGTNFVVIVN